MTAKGPLRVVPTLRFPEFADEPAWECLPLSKLAKRITQRNTQGEALRPLTNSAEHGVVDQREYFDKDIATNTDNYFIVEPGDYVYNPRVSSVAPVGPISKNFVGTGVVSPLYTVFRFRSGANDFFAHYFKSSHWHGYLRRASNSGARHDRMAITNDDFMEMPIPTPSPHEQQKITDCLGSLDELIAAEGRKLEALRQHKQGLMAQLFPRPGETVPRLRFPEFSDQWKETTLGKQCHSISSGKDKSDPDGQFDLYGSTGIIGKTHQATFTDTALLVARVGANAGLLTKAEGEFGVTDNTLVVSLKDPRNVDFILHYLENSGLNRMSYGSGQPLITGGQLKALMLWTPGKQERERIADCFSSLDACIAGQSRRVESLRQHKQGLQQQFFPSLECTP